MKKWLNDLYTILMKRGFNTLDNSLMNYATLDKQIAKEVQSGSINNSGSVSYNFDNYDSEIGDILLIKFIFSNGGVGVILAFNNIKGIQLLISLGTSPNFTISVYQNAVYAMNNTGADVEYSLYINTI